MKLSELDPRLLKIKATDTWQIVQTISEADGIHFLCPVCFKTNNGPVGTHSIICWKPHVPQEMTPGPGRWNIEGTSIDNLTLVAGSSSILLREAPCHAHFYVKNGQIEFCI